MCVRASSSRHKCIHIWWQRCVCSRALATLLMTGVSANALNERIVDIVVLFAFAIAEWIVFCVSHSMYLHYSTPKFYKTCSKCYAIISPDRTLTNKTHTHTHTSSCQWKYYRMRKWDHSYPIKMLRVCDIIFERRGQYGKRQCAKKTANAWKRRKTHTVFTVRL